MAALVRGYAASAAQAPLLASLSALGAPDAAFALSKSQAALQASAACRAVPSGQAMHDKDISRALSPSHLSMKAQSLCASLSGTCANKQHEHWVARMHGQVPKAVRAGLAALEGQWDVLVVAALAHARRACPQHPR